MKVLSTQQCWNTTCLAGNTHNSHHTHNVRNYSTKKGWSFLYISISTGGDSMWICNTDHLTGAMVVGVVWHEMRFSPQGSIVLKALIQAPSLFCRCPWSSWYSTGLTLISVVLLLSVCTDMFGASRLVFFWTFLACGYEIYCVRTVWSCLHIGFYTSCLLLHRWHSLFSS